MKVTKLVAMLIVFLYSTALPAEDSALLDSLLEVEDPKLTKYINLIEQHPDRINGVDAYLGFFVTYHFKTGQSLQSFYTSFPAFMATTGRGIYLRCSVSSRIRVQTVNPLKS